MEQVLPPDTASGTGFESTRLRQFTVFLENKVGRLQALLGSFEKREGTIVGLSIEESGDSALVRLIFSDAEACREAIVEAGFTCSETDLLAVELPTRKKQPLVAICTALLGAEINIHYAYPLLTRPRGPAMAMYVDDPTLAAQILIRKGFGLIGESDLK